MSEWDTCTILKPSSWKTSRHDGKMFSSLSWLDKKSLHAGKTFPFLSCCDISSYVYVQVKHLFTLQLNKILLKNEHLPPWINTLTCITLPHVTVSMLWKNEDLSRLMKTDASVNNQSVQWEQRAGLRALTLGQKKGIIVLRAESCPGDPNQHRQYQAQYGRERKGKKERNSWAGALHIKRTDDWFLHSLEVSGSWWK